MTPVALFRPAAQASCAADAPAAVAAPPAMLARAWALKDACHAAWSSDPQQAVGASESLSELLDTARALAEPAEVVDEIAAISAWTQGIALLTQGRMEPACERFDQAEAAFLRLARPGLAAQTQVPKVMALTILGRHADAADCGERAQRALRAAGDRRAASKVSLNLGSLQMRRDAYADAARHYRSAAVGFARVGDREHSVMADIGLGDALTAQGDFAEALRIYARARMRAGAHALPVLKAMVDESVALLELARGRLRDALDGLERSRRSYAALAMPQHLAIAEKQLGDAYLELRLLPEALSLLDAAVASFGALDMPDDQAWALVQRGRTLALLGRPGAAGQSLSQARLLFGSQGNAVGGAAVSMALAELALAEGDAPGALAPAMDAADALAQAGQADGACRAAALAAQAQLEAGQVDAAGSAFAAALDRACGLQLLSLQVRCHTGLGRVAVARGDDGAAARSFGQAIELFEAQRRSLPGDDMRSAFLADHLRPFEELLRLALKRADAGDGAHVLQQLDRFRARALGDRLHDGGGPAPDPATDALRARLNWLYRRAQRLRDDGTPSATLDDLLRQTEHRLLEQARRQRLTDAPAGTMPGAADDLLDLPSLQSLLADGDALVEYGVLDDELFACVVTRDGVRLQRHMASWAAATALIHSTRFQLQSLRDGLAPVAHLLPELTRRAHLRLGQLHARVWAPLAPLVAGCRRVMVVPHGALGMVPFAALHDGEQALAARFDLAVAPSARVALRGLQRPPVTPRRVLALGDSGGLPQAAAEARFVAALFGHGRAAIDAGATRQALLDGVADADVLHLACHAAFRDDNPAFSALQLHDGPLTAEAAERLPLRAGTVVLSGCDTALAGHDRGDDRVGLVRAFMVAGAARVLASLWPVDDAITLQFMARFYLALGQGSTPAAALRAAQTGLQQVHPHPFHWAAFTLHGGW